MGLFCGPTALTPKVPSIQQIPSILPLHLSCGQRIAPGNQKETMAPVLAIGFTSVLKGYHNCKEKYHTARVPYRIKIHLASFVFFARLRHDKGIRGATIPYGSGVLSLARFQGGFYDNSGRLVSILDDLTGENFIIREVRWPLPATLRGL